MVSKAEMKNIYPWLSIAIVMSCLFTASLSLGEITFNSDLFYQIFWTIRFPKTLTAIMAGAALGVSGLMMQTLFMNPLAGPFVLGIHSGASLGVAILVMGIHFFPALSPYLYFLGPVGMAIMGAFFTLFFLLSLSWRLKNNVTLLIVGLIMSFFVSGVLNILISLSDAHRIKSFLIWNLGSFSRISGNELILFSSIVIVGVFISLFFARHFDLLLLGEDYALSSGLNLRKTRFIVILLTAILAGGVTAFCGPIAFVGLLAPHFSRRILKNQLHRNLIPYSALSGASMALFAEVLTTQLWEGTSFPVNAILGLLGAPLLLLFILRREEC